MQQTINKQLIESADIDLIGAYVGAKEHYLGLSKADHWMPENMQLDIKMYELRKYMRLLLKQNPSLIETLFLKVEHMVIWTPAFWDIMKARKYIISKKAFDSFSGYARGQMHRMEERETKGRMGAKRKELVEKFGYDPKNASHLIRLLKMSIELLKTGEMEVARTTDAEMLRAIKRGEWALEDIKALAEQLFEQAERAKERSTLREKPDEKLVEQMTVSIVGRLLGIPGI